MTDDDGKTSGVPDEAAPLDSAPAVAGETAAIVSVVAADTTATEAPRRPATDSTTTAAAHRSRTHEGQGQGGQRGEVVGHELAMSTVAELREINAQHARVMSRAVKERRGASA